MKLRWLIRDDVRVLQYYSDWEDWRDVEEITENQVLLNEQYNKERKLEDVKRIEEQFRGKTYTVRK